MQMLIFNFLVTENPFEIMVAPVIDLINSAVGPMLMLVSAVGMLYCIILGIKLIKAVEPQDRQKAKDHLKNAIFGFALIFVLIIVLRVGVTPLTQWMERVGGITVNTFDTVS